jgi:hypothetical protein
MNSLSALLRLYSKSSACAAPQYQHPVHMIEALDRGFSSTKNTASRTGGFRYDPISSAAKVLKSGALDTVHPLRNSTFRSA